MTSKEIKNITKERLKNNFFEVGDLYRHDMEDSYIIILSNSNSVVEILNICYKRSDKFIFENTTIPKLNRKLSKFENGFSYYFVSNNKQIIDVLIESYVWGEKSEEDLKDNTNRNYSIDQILRAVELTEKYPDLTEYLKNEKNFKNYI